MADAHFWLGTFGILLYVGSMWTSGITQGLMWRATDAQGALVYPNFVETLNAIRPMYWMRLIGGTAYLVGMVMMAYNLARTALAGHAVDGTIEVPVAIKQPVGPSWPSLIFGKPVVLAVVTFGLAGAFALSNMMAGVAFASAAFVVGVLGVIAVRSTGGGEGAWHRLLEGRALLFTVLTLLAVLAGGVAEIVPSLLVKPAESADARPYRALELEGRDIYLREGCYNCHSQMIRPFRSEQQRYGEPSAMSDSQFDHPFQWGSKRTGPDLAREGNKYPNVWHYQHLTDPRAVSPGSNMPPYAQLATDTLDFARTEEKLRAMRSLGVPYNDHAIATAAEDARTQGREISADLHTAGVDLAPDAEMVALMAYLQRLGAQPAPQTVPTPSHVSMTP
jgi:cytochrome c oxidase cbb3-type subunit I/II